MHYIGTRTGGQWTRRVTTEGTEGVESKRQGAASCVPLWPHQPPYWTEVVAWWRCSLLYPLTDNVMAQKTKPNLGWMQAKGLRASLSVHFPCALNATVRGYFPSGTLFGEYCAIWDIVTVWSLLRSWSGLTPVIFLIIRWGGSKDTVTKCFELAHIWCASRAPSRDVWKSTMEHQCILSKNIFEWSLHISTLWLLCFRF